MRCRVAGMLAGVTLLLGACGQSGTTASPDTASSAAIDHSAIVARIMSHCTDLESPDLGAGTLCVDNGFRLRTDDFSFSNWGRSADADANVTVQTLIDLFGHGAVCMPSGRTDECVPRPGTRQVIDEWNTALAGGRCEGMATLATRFMLRMDSPSDFASGATTVAELSRSDGRLDSWIAYWWATQFIDEVSSRAAESRTHSPIELLDQLVQGLANDVGFTLGLYHATGGHSVVPFAVTRRSGMFIVHVYDNNHPHQRREISIDPTTDTWTYVDAQPGDTWSGGTGTFELTPMSSRQGPFTCPFCTAPREGSATTVTIASRDANAPGFVLLRAGRGEIASTPSGLTNTIHGAKVTSIKGAGASISIVIPADIENFSVSVRRGRQAVSAGDVVVTVRRPGHAAVQVTGNLATRVVGDNADDAVVRLTANNTTVTAPVRDVARVSVASGSDIVRRRLRAGESMIVGRQGQRTIEIALKGAQRGSTERTVLPVRTRGSSTEIDLADDGDRLVVTESIVLPVSAHERSAVNFVPRARPSTTTAPPHSIVVSDPG